MFTEGEGLLELKFPMSSASSAQHFDEIMRTGFHTDLVTFTSSPPRSDHRSYKEETVIGNGAYGTVYKAKDINRPERWVALKKVRIPLSDDGVPVSILREISMVKQLERFQHPNVVRFLDVCNGPMLSKGDNNLPLFLVFEYVESDLAKYIQVTPRESLDARKIKDIMFQILCGLDFLHGQRIVHRDLKPQNLLMSANGTVKLADFGLSKIYDFSMKLTSVVVTLWYRAPEVLLGGQYGSPIDMWALGCIFAELYRKRPIFPGESERDQLEKIFDVLGKDDETESHWPRESRVLPHSFRCRPSRTWEVVVPGIDSEGLHLLRKMLTFNPLKRITAQEALHHDFFEGRPIPPVDMDGTKNTELDLEDESSSSSTTPHRQLLSSSPMEGRHHISVSDESLLTSPSSLNSTSADDSGYASMYSHS